MNFDSFPKPEIETPEKKPDEPKRSRIAWKSKLTGATGHGEYLENETVEAWLEKAQKENPDLEHWLESEDEASRENQGATIEASAADFVAAARHIRETYEIQARFVTQAEGDFDNAVNQFGREHPIVQEYKRIWDNSVRATRETAEVINDYMDKYPETKDVFREQHQ